MSSVAMSDRLICREADLIMDGLGNKKDRKQDDVYRVSQAARTHFRLLLASRRTVSMPNLSLTDLLEPHRFDLVVEVTKHMSFNKVTPALNLGKTIGNLLTNACRSKYCLALREGDSKAKEDALTFQKLIEREWNDRVSRVALKRMQTEKRSKIPTIPLTADLQIFRDYLIRNIEQLCIHLKKHPWPKTGFYWQSLS